MEDGVHVCCCKDVDATVVVDNVSYCAEPREERVELRDDFVFSGKSPQDWPRGCWGHFRFHEDW